MRLWLGLVTVLALLLPISCVEYIQTTYDHIKLIPCPEKTVCIVFSDYECQVKNVYPVPVYGIKQGFVWEKQDSPICKKVKGNDFYGVYAELEIQPINLYKWKVTAILVEKDPDGKDHTPEEFRFNFGTSELTFSNGSPGKAKFERTKDGKNIDTSDNPLEKSKSFISYDYNIIRTNTVVNFGVYTFEIALNEEKVIDYAGPVVTLDITGPNAHHFLLNDTTFPEKLSELTNCVVSDIKEMCYDTCDKIFSDLDLGSGSDSNSTAEHSESLSAEMRETNCPSTLWFHSPSEAKLTRKWKKVDGQLKCDMGWWHGDTSSGVHTIYPSMEVQCSEAEPTSLTSLGKIVIGVSCGVGGLMIVVLIVVVCVLMKRRRNHEFGGNTEKKFTLRDSDSKSKAQTPVGMTKSTEREKI